MRIYVTVNNPTKRSQGLSGPSYVLSICMMSLNFTDTMLDASVPVEKFSRGCDSPWNLTVGKENSVSGIEQGSEGVNI